MNDIGPVTMGNNVKRTGALCEMYFIRMKCYLGEEMWYSCDSAMLQLFFYAIVVNCLYSCFTFFVHAFSTQQGGYVRATNCYFTKIGWLGDGLWLLLILSGDIGV